MSGYNVSFIEHIPCVKWQILPNASISYFRESVYESMDIFRDFIDSYPNLNILVDLENLIELMNRDITWFGNEVLTDLLLNRGVKHIAIVKPRSRMMLKQFKDVLNLSSQLHVVESFDTVELATEWLVTIRDTKYKTPVEMF